MARYRDESVEVFFINQSNGNLAPIQQLPADGNGGFLPTMTLVSPLQ